MIEDIEMNEVNIDISEILIGDDTELDFNLNDFKIDGIDEVKKRYKKPVFKKLNSKVSYENARKFAKDIKLEKGEQFHAIIQGNFIFGDMIEALLIDRKLQCSEMYISTLSLSQNNVDSLAGLIKNENIINLNLILSNYFYSHEKHKLMKYLLQECDIENKLDVMIIRNHTKIILMRINNMHIVISGSSNLRSSNSIEQIIIQESEELYNFYRDWFENYRNQSIINKEVKA